MNQSVNAPLNLSREELAILIELLESDRDRLLVEIHRTDHRHYRDQLRQRLDAEEQLTERLRPA